MADPAPSTDEPPRGTRRRMRLWCAAEGPELDLDRAGFDEPIDPPSLMDAAPLADATNLLLAPANDRAEEDMRRTLHDALRAAAEQIEEFARQPASEPAELPELSMFAPREGLEPPAVPSRGRINKLFVAYGYGLVDTWDGKSVYFHENAVMGYGFSSLRVGDVVQLVVASDGAWGHRATAVMRIGRVRRTRQTDA